MQQLNIYGIANCDVTKAALSWLKSHKIDPVFHDYKKEGISKHKLEDWCKQAGWENLLNKRSTTWRELTAKEQAMVTNEAGAVKIMMEHNSIIKRPVIESRGKLIIGFKEENYSKQLK